MEVNAARIPEKWVNPIRVVVVLIVLLHVGLFAGGLAPRFAELTQVCDPILCEPLEPTEADMIALEGLGLSLTFYAVFHIAIEIALVLVSMLLIGLLFWRASHLWIGIIAILGVTGIATMVANVIYALGEIAPELFPLFLFAYVISTTGLTLTFYSFPDGRFYPKWTPLPLLILIPTYTVAFASTGADFIETPLSGVFPLLGISATALILNMILGFVTQLIRYRRYYDHQRRQQTRWLMTSIVGMILGVLIWGLLFESTLIPYGPARMLTSFIGMTILMLFSVGLIPYALTIAILRYRLWNIDLIIRRTLIYGVVTTLLGLIYLSGVALFQRLFSRIAGESSSLAVVISTLTIAALFNPLRNRVQGSVDRAFYRQKYDAKKTLDRFGAQARNEIDIDGLETALLYAVQETVQPESVGLWIRPSEKKKTRGAL